MAHWSVIILINKQLHKNTNIVMACLSFSDLVVNVLAQPLFVLHTVNNIISRNTNAINIDGFIHKVFLVTSGSSLVFLTILNADRALACTFPLFHKVQITKKRLLLASLVTWASFVPWTVFAPKTALQIGSPIQCYILLLIILTSAVLMIHSLTKNNNSVLVNGNETQMLRLQAIQRKATKTVLAFLALYFLLYIPPTVLFLRHNGKSQTLQAISLTLAFTNSFLNAVIYIFRSLPICQKYKDICGLVSATRARVLPLNN